MKFILQETTKFILEERFVLDEGIILTEAQATAKQLVIDLNKLDTLLPELLKHLTGSGELEIPEEIKTGCSEVLKLVTETRDLKTLMDQIREKASNTNPEENFTDDMIKVLQPLCYNIASDGNSVKDRLKSIRSHKGIIEEQTAALQERVPSLKTNIEELYKLFEDKEPDEPTEYKYSLNDESIELKKGNKFILKVTVEPEKEITPKFESTNAEIATVDESGTITAVAAGEAEIKVTVDEKELICKVKVLADEEEPEEEETTGTEDDDEVDWAAKYNAATNKDAVWEEYLNIVWADDIDKINLINDAFRQECISYGFDKTNPFITFIKETYLKTSMPGPIYEVIHNAIVDRSLTTKDILGKGKLGFYNIIFCPDFYTKDVANAAAYVKKQSNLVNKGEPEEFKTLLEFIVNLMYKLPKRLAEADLKIEMVSTFKLNTFAKINELEEAATGSVSNDEKDDLKIDDAFVQQIDTLETAAQIIVALLLRFATNTKLINIAEQYKEIVTLFNQDTKSATLHTLFKNLDTKYKLKNIKESQAVTLATKIVSSNKFKFTKA